MNWNNIVEHVTPYVVRIETPDGYGTGFLYLYNDSKTFCGIATAGHVVSHADEWQQAIRIRHYPSGRSALLKEHERVVYVDYMKDSAVILLSTGHFDFPENVIPLFPTAHSIGIGVEVGWLGFPIIEASTLCFFSGNVSARHAYREAYLIDGVAISGVSGGPVLFSTDTEGVQIVGTVSAYRPSKTSGDTLPGLLLAQDVSHFHDIITRVKSIDEANKQKQLLAQDQEVEAVEAAEPATQD